MTVCGCGAEFRGHGAGPLCPACLIRLALEPDSPDHVPPLVDETTTRLLGPIGRGPHGTVYLAHRAIDEPNFVTVKVLNAPHVSADFLDSVRDTSRRLSAMAPADTSHLLEPGVTTDGRVYVVAKYIPGPSITDYVTRRHCNSLDRVRLGERVCSRVADLHRHGITHGSIKSSNVIVVETPGGPLPVLLDTGIVPAISESRQRRDQVDGGGSAMNGEEQDVAALRTLLGTILEQAPFRTLEDAKSAAALAAILKR